MIDKENEEGNGNDENKDGEKGNEKKNELVTEDEGFPTWGIVLAVVVAVAIALVIIYFVIRHFKKSKKDELVGSRLIPLSDVNKYY